MDDFSAVMTVGLLVASRNLEWSRLWTFTNFSGLPEASPIFPKQSNLAWLFCLGLLLPAYTITGFDASAHTSEETVDAARKAAVLDAALSPALTPRDLRLLAAAAGIAVLSALVVLGGQAAFSRPPAPIVEQAKALTPEQTLALQNADKLTKAIEKLDPKVRSQLQAELKK